MKKLMVTTHGASTSNQQAITETSPSNKPRKRKRNDDHFGGLCYLRSRMSPNMLMTFINSGLSEQQVSDIKDMGFGGLLTLKTDQVPGALAYWLVSCFNSVSCSYMKGRFHITDEDIHLSTGIPIGGNEVQIASLNDRDEEFVKLRKSWLQQFGTDVTKVDTKDIVNLLMTQKEGGEDFKRNFIVFVVSSFLMGVKGTCASLRALKCLQDVSCIQTLNWCQFTRKQFIKSVDSWRTSKTELFGGPIMVFVFCYLDRVCYKFFSVPRVFPTLATWTKDTISERLMNEMQDGFGTGAIVPRIVKGTVKEVIFNVSSGEEPNEPKETNASESDSKHRNAVMELAESAVILADAYAKFSDALDRAKVTHSDCKVVQQLAEMADALCACCPSSQPKDTSNCDDDIEKDRQNSALNSPPTNIADDSEKDNENGGDSNQDEHDSQTSKPWRKLNGQSFNSEEELLAALVKLEIAMGKRPVTVETKVMKKEKSSILVDSKGSSLIFPKSQKQKAAQASSSLRRSPRFTDQSQPLPDPIIPQEDENVESTVLKKGKSANLVESNAPSLKLPKSTIPIYVDSQSQEELFEPLNFEKAPEVSRSPSHPLPDPITPPSFKLLSSDSEKDVAEKGCDDALKIRAENIETNVLKKAKYAKLVESKVLPSKSQKKAAQASTSSRRSPRFTHHSPPVFTPPSCPLPDPSTPSIFSLVSSESQEDVLQKMADDASKFCDDALNINENVEALEVEPLSSLPPNEPTKMNTTRVKRLRVQTEAFRSPFLQRSIRLDGKMNKIEREVLDYVFLESSDESEILFKTGTDLSVTRADLKTLVSGDRVPKQVIDSWCCILNKGETIRALTSPPRLYLPLSAELSSHIDDNFTGAVLIFVPIISEKPFAICFNFLSKKLEILHLMSPQSVNYLASIESTKDFVIRCLVHKMPSIVNVQDMKVEEITVLRTNLGNRNDPGSYLMRLLEKYKGEKRTCVLGLQDNNQVKLFGTRACYEMLSSDCNQLKDKVLNAAGSFSLDIRHEVSTQGFQIAKKTIRATKTQRRERQLTDTEIVGLVLSRCNNAKSLDENLVETEWMSVCRSAMRTLQYRAWLRDTVIDMFGVMCTYNRPDILYLPSTVQHAKPELKVTEANFVWCPYLKMHYRPKDGATVEKVFFTIGKNNKHWFACVCDLKQKKNFILDSLRPYRKTDKKVPFAYTNYVEEIVCNVANQIPTSNGYKRLKGICLFPIEVVDVPQQDNTFDCGLYVMKFLEATMTNTDLWKDKNHYADLVAYRRQVILRLIKWDKNTSQVIPKVH